MSGARTPVGDELDAVAGWVQRLAVLLSAGLEPLAAARALRGAPRELTEAAGCDSPFDVPGRVVEAAAAGSPGTLRAWQVLAAAWTVALESGAPLAGALDRISESLAALADADRQVDLALAGPAATARLVALLPVVGLVMGVALGADPVGVLLGTVPGAVSGLLGVGLLAVGVRWNRKLVSAARRYDPLAGVGPELLSLALASGGGPQRASEVVGDAAERCGIALDLADAHETLAFAERAGVPVVALLRAEAVRARRRSLAAALRQAALLGSRLLAPLGLCFLPAFALLGVVPLLIGILRGSLDAFG